MLLKSKRCGGRQAGLTDSVFEEVYDEPQKRIGRVNVRPIRYTRRDGAVECIRRMLAGSSSWGHIAFPCLHGRVGAVQH